MAKPSKELKLISEAIEVLKYHIEKISTPTNESRRNVVCIYSVINFIENIQSRLDVLYSLLKDVNAGEVVKSLEEGFHNLYSCVCSVSIIHNANSLTRVGQVLFYLYNNLVSLEKGVNFAYKNYYPNLENVFNFEGASY